MVISIRRILAATDLSGCAAHAETRAAMLCSELKGNALELLTVIDASLPGSLARLVSGTQESAETSLAEHSANDLKRIALRLQNEIGINCDYSVEFGRPATRIASKADALSADLIVVGAHGCNSVNSVFLGNTPYKLLHIGKRSLLIVKNSPTHAYRDILVPVDFSEHSRRAAQTALAIAPNADVTLLHGFEVVNEGLMRYSGVTNDYIRGYRTEASENAVRDMERFVSALEKGDRMVSSIVQFGYAPLIIQEYADRFKPDLIVIGKHGKSRVEDFLLGSVTRHSIDETTCDILVTVST